ncbi:MAG: hypothetical protein CMJ83_00610 [Planctomycetes bacterium]|nr:hypothetical protein [Planctomycetota bacterium]
MSRFVACAAILAAAVAVAPAQGQQVATITPSKDNTLYFHPLGMFSNGVGTHVFAGLNANARARRALLAFDIAGSVPAGSTIVSAMLQLTMDQTIAGTVNCSLHALTADWGEGTSNAFTGGGGGGAAATPTDATWIHTFNPGSFWTAPGGDFVATASATTPVGSSSTYLWTSNQMATDVQNWLNAPATNFGWILRTPETVPPSAKRFGSREHPSAANRPTLFVTFTPPSASATINGVGCNVSAIGLPYSLTANGLPTLGNASFALNFMDGHANGVATLYVAQGLAIPPLPVGNGCNIYLDIASALGFIASGISPLGPFPLDGLGAFTMPLPLPLDPALIGFTIDGQAISIDPTTGQSATSNALSLVLG